MKGKLLEKFYEPTTVSNKSPINYSEKNTGIFNGSLTIKLTYSGLYVLKNVRVTNMGIIYKKFFSIKDTVNQ
jgi:hypothetical protein